MIPPSRSVIHALSAATMPLSMTAASTVGRETEKQLTVLTGLQRGEANI